MRIKKYWGSIVVILITAVLLAACGGKPKADPNQKMTEIAATVQAQLTQSAASNPTSTPTPEPTATATPSPSTPTVPGVISSPDIVDIPTQPGSTTQDGAKFISDVTFPDGSVVKTGEQFIKTWRLQNTGKTTWTKDFSVLYLEGVLLGRDNMMMFKLPAEVKPGEFADVSVPFTAPMQTGNFGSYWIMYNSSGFVFGEYFSINITVGQPTATPKPPTATPTPTATSIITGTVVVTATTPSGWGTDITPEVTSP